MLLWILIRAQGSKLQGWWLGKQCRMQQLLCIKTFNKVFRAIVPEGYVLTVPIEQLPMEFKFVDQLDWSQLQEHAELPKDALDATVSIWVNLATQVYRMSSNAL